MEGGPPGTGFDTPYVMHVLSAKRYIYGVLITMDVLTRRPRNPTSTSYSQIIQF